MNKKVSLLSVAVAGLLALCVAGCNKDGGKWHNEDIWLKAGLSAPTEAYTLPTDPDGYGAASVHDPSVFQDPKDGTYYAFGTHFTVASSTDLIHWKQEIAEGSDADKKLYGGKTHKEVLTKMLDWTNGGTGTTWAPDVEYIDGKYYMYISSTSAFGSSRSAISVVESNNVLGPYRNERLVVTSEGDGSSNAIDPELFYDKEGKLWMVYGSAFGGLFIKELETSGDRVGLPKDEDTTAKGDKIWQGGRNCEGPFIFYNAETDYYYLMTSYDSLESDYNMRVARSKSPNEGFRDITDTPVVSTMGKGNKLAGNYQFTGGPTDTALGHNSVIKTEDGKYIVVMHVRNGVKGAHHVEARQLFFNKEGWPVLSPNKYAGETMGKITQEQAANTYDVVVHTSLGADASYAKSQACTFNKDGTVTGALTGTWSVEDDFYVTLTLGEKTYKGVVVPQWCHYKDKPIFSIMATADDGMAVWANSAEITA